MDREESQSIQKRKSQNLNENIMPFRSNKEPDKTKADRTWLREILEIAELTTPIPQFSSLFLAL